MSFMPLFTNGDRESCDFTFFAAEQHGDNEDIPNLVPAIG